MRKKVVVASVLVVLAALLFAMTVYASDAIRVTIDGEQVVFEGQGPTIVSNRTLVPVRGVFEHLGFDDINWNPQTRQATLANDEFTLVFTIGSSTFTNNGTSHSLDVPAQLIGGRTMLPLRAPLESIGYYLDWDGGTRTVIISSTPFEESQLMEINR